MDRKERRKQPRPKILLVLANTRWGGKRPWLGAPYAAMLLTGLLKEEFDFQILDANGEDLSEQECKSRIKEYTPEVVLVSGVSTEYNRQFHTAIALAKSALPDVVTVFGGVYPTLLPQRILKDPNVDFVFIGHAEDRVSSFIKLVLSKDKDRLDKFSGIGFRTQDNEIKINPVSSYIFNVKKMVKPDYSLIDYERYVYNNGAADPLANSLVRSAAILTSYGCVYNCVFCASNAICGRGVAYRPVEDVLDEIKYLKGSYRIEELVFYDELFIADKERIKKILNTLIDYDYGLTWKVVNVSAWDVDDELLVLMKKSGCVQMGVSVESGSQRVLREIIHKPLRLEIIKPIVKKCKELGMDIRANFIFGLPGETWDEMRSTFRFAEECDFDLASFHIANPFPGTGLYRMAKEKKAIPEDFDFLDSETLGYRRAFISTDEFTPQDLMVLSSYEWDRINFKTPEKTAKIARMYGITVEELNRRRKKSRENLGRIW